MIKHARIIKILSLIEKAYGRVPPLRRTDPVDELVRTILSQNTSDKNSVPAFNKLKAAFNSWDEALSRPSSRIASLIKHAGLENIKADRIKSVLGEVKAREGSISLSRLGSMDPAEAGAYLQTIKGVGPKTAACVLLFSFNMPVMPVDTHILRVSKRLGLADENLTALKAHQALTALVPPDLIYRFHLGIIEHGRRICKALKPSCEACVLYDMCGYRLKKIYRKDKSGYNTKS